MTVNTQTRTTSHGNTAYGERSSQSAGSARGLIVVFTQGGSGKPCGDAVGAVRCELCGYLVKSIVGGKGAGRGPGLSAGRPVPLEERLRDG